MSYVFPYRTGTNIAVLPSDSLAYSSIVNKHKMGLKCVLYEFFGPIL
jgi:hypothetical protein